MSNVNITYCRGALQYVHMHLCIYVHTLNIYVCTVHQLIKLTLHINFHIYEPRNDNKLYIFRCTILVHQENKIRY